MKDRYLFIDEARNWGELLSALNYLRTMALTLADASAVALDPNQVSYQKGQGGPPRGASERLIDTYAGMLRAVAYKMARDIERQQRRSPLTGQEIKEERDKRITTMYEGWPPQRVAVFEDLGVTTVREIRERHQRDPLTGVLH